MAQAMPLWSRNEVRVGDERKPEGIEPADTPISHPEDWGLVQGCIGGDRRCWAELITRYEPVIEMAVRHTLHVHGVRQRPALVEDLCADVAVSLVKNDFRKLRRYSGRCRLGPWLKVVASHQTIDALRKRRPTVSLNADTEQSRALRESLASPSLPADVALARRQRVEQLHELYETLSQDDRQFVALFCEQGLSFEEIAEKMGTTVGAIYARKNRVRKKLQRQAQRRGLL